MAKETNARKTESMEKRRFKYIEDMKLEKDLEEQTGGTKNH